MVLTRTRRARRSAQDDLSSLPAVRSAGVDFSGMLDYDSIPSELAEALRRIINRHELHHDELPATIAVTAALRGEGTTSVSQALSTLLAQESGSYVCWVDCSWLARDGAQPPDDGRPSLIEILADKSKVLSAFQASPELQQLIVLSSGRVPESKRNMIVRSPEFDQLIDVLAAEFDHVIFDIPPVLQDANGLALVRQSDASLLVVQQRSTSIAQFERAVEATQPTPNLGVVLNRFDSRIPRRVARFLGD